jgi:hypothetical protein
MSEPAHPFEGGELHHLGAAPWAAPADHFGLEQADDRLSESIVAGIADAADGGLDAGFGQPLGVADRSGSSLTLSFEKPISGPLALGFGCHYGLGLMRGLPITTRSSWTTAR